MEITEVRIKLMEDSDDRLQAFCSITFDDSFVVRDLKIIEGANGPFVAMPSRKLTTHCPNCGGKNHIRALYCNQCGKRMREERPVRDEDGRAKLYADIAHPINSACREMIQSRVIAEYDQEKGRSQEPGYISRYDDDYDDDPLDLPPPDPSSRTSQIQPPQTSFQGPHHPAPRPSSPPAAEPAPKKNPDDFGAGVFEG
ncbi:SpoVG family protein [Lignipirellula cremea]|uniref:Septation protein SpoVG n=1 Tax=Lignipirellula cremea TaxID=2528010 RepID=A0A518DUM6_9BACT|nr:SpoVG family protein [Lignipirellula cremea]QDU95540.1 Putative septation protein SpoVG [Lignipirellula cremea]